MISQTKILAAIAAIMLTESLVEAQRRNSRRRDDDDDNRPPRPDDSDDDDDNRPPRPDDSDDDDGDDGQGGPRVPSDIGYFATQLYQNQSAAA